MNGKVFCGAGGFVDGFVELDLTTIKRCTFGSTLDVVGVVGVLHIDDHGIATQDGFAACSSCGFQYSAVVELFANKQNVVCGQGTVTAIKLKEVDFVLGGVGDSADGSLTTRKVVDGDNGDVHENSFFTVVVALGDNQGINIGVCSGI